MTQLDRDNNKGGSTRTSERVSAFIERLTDEHRMLIVLKAQLYGGSWDPMLDDLKNRLAGKPYIFKLATRIKDDIARIEIMQGFELEQDIDLANLVDLE
jgi:hypothetical protein